MTPEEALEWLERVQRGEATTSDALQALREAPIEDLGFAAVDLHRSLRQGAGEVVYGAGKTPAQVTAITERLVEANGRALVTRVSDASAAALRRRLRGAVHHREARCVTVIRKPAARTPGYVAVVAAGTSDLPVAEEAAVTAEFHGCEARRIYDVGVAGLHRLLRRLPEIQGAAVIVAVAGMEAALASVLGGLVDRPMIAAPTSVGYGSNFGGVAALLGMLNSCASGVTVVNIDNGFGAGFAAARISRALGQAAARGAQP